MTKLVHIVYVHPVELGEPNLHKVEHEVEFDRKADVNKYIRIWNKDNVDTKAVYHGCVNDETGELV